MRGNEISTHQRLTEQLSGSQFDDLRKDIVVYIKRALKLHKRFPTVELHKLNEVSSMLSERIDLWEENCREKGREEGREEGRNEARAVVSRQEKLTFLSSLLTLSGIKLSDKTKHQIEKSTNDELQRRIDLLLQKLVAGKILETD